MPVRAQPRAAFAPASPRVLAWRIWYHAGMDDSFKTKVYETVKKIPVGKVATYGQVAMLAGNPRASRAVGMLMSRNKEPKMVPCHRVVGAGGLLKGYAFNGIMAKREKLVKEGVHFIGARVMMPLHHWRPKAEH